MAEFKTKPTDAVVDAFPLSVPEPAQSECRELVAMMRSATGTDPVMWGSGIVGFGSTHIRNASRQEGAARRHRQRRPRQLIDEAASRQP